MKRCLIVLFVAALAGCASTADDQPRPPVSEHSTMPWNTPRPGEGQGAFGGVFNQYR